MNSELLIKQIETYSNAIIAFMVLQGLAYSYAFGTNPFFNCLVKTAEHLAEGLALLFGLNMLLSIVATVSLGRALNRISGEFRSTVEKIYLGKLIVVIIFGLLPLVLTYGYGVGDYPNKMECKTAAGHCCKDSS
jgi:hypothetical protein